jgi:2',3'-cyclic-nucleotide 2'-phosphodiesterase (5'-nucleotidase family)
MKRIIVFILSLFLLFSIACKKENCDCNRSDDNLKRIYILNTGDIHEMSYYLPKLAHYIKKFRDDRKNIILLDAGDRITYWPTYKLYYENGTHQTVNTDIKSLHTDGRAMLEIMNLLDYDAMIFGNHSWVYTIDTMVARINQYSLPILSCNIIYPPNIPAIPSKVFTFGDVKIGVVGVTTNNYDHVMPGDSLNAAASNSQFVINEINALQNSADLVVLLTHELDQTDELSIYTMQGFDILIGGHSHNALNANIIGRLMTKAGLAGMYVGVSEIIWDTENDKLSGFNYWVEYMEDYPYEDAEVKAAVDALLN